MTQLDLFTDATENREPPPRGPPVCRRCGGTGLVGSPFCGPYREPEPPDPCPFCRGGLKTQSPVAAQAGAE